MRIIISILLFLFAFKSEGQIINASQPYRPLIISGGGCNYLLDSYGGATVAYSIRNLDCDYTGYAIRVRRSNDNTEQNIGFTSSGDLDTTSLKSFVSSNSGYVVTWYDQMGFKNVTQATTSRQPTIVNSGVIVRVNGKPALYFDGTDYLYSTDTGLPTGSATYVTVTYNTENPITANGYKRIIYYGTGANGTVYSFLYLHSVAPTIQLGVGQSANEIVINYSTLTHTLQFFTKPATNGYWYHWHNNVANSKNMLTSTTLDGGSQSFMIGAGSGFFIGDMQEIIMWGSDKSSDRTNIQSNINSYYSIY